MMNTVHPELRDCIKDIHLNVKGDLNKVSLKMFNE